MQTFSFLILLFHLLSTSIALPAVLSHSQDIHNEPGENDTARDLSVYLTPDFKRPLRPLRTLPGPLPYRYIIPKPGKPCSIVFENYGDPAPRPSADILLQRFFTRYSDIYNYGPDHGMTWINGVQSMREGPLRITVSGLQHNTFAVAQVLVYVYGLTRFFRERGYVECRFSLASMNEDNHEWETIAAGYLH